MAQSISLQCAISVMSLRSVPCINILIVTIIDRRDSRSKKDYSYNFVRLLGFVAYQRTSKGLGYGEKLDQKSA